MVCTDLWGKELHRQVAVGKVVTSGSLHGNVSTLDWNERWVFESPSRHNISNFHRTLDSSKSRTSNLDCHHAIIEVSSDIRVSCRCVFLFLCVHANWLFWVLVIEPECPQPGFTSPANLTEPRNSSQCTLLVRWTAFTRNSLTASCEFSLRSSHSK